MAVEFELRHTLEGDSGIAFGEAWSPNGKLLAVAGFDPGPRIWDVATAQLRVTAEHPQRGSCIAWSPNGFALVAGSSAGEILMLDAMSGRIRARTVGHGDEVRSVAYSPDARSVASCANDGTLGIWSAVDASRITAIQAHQAIARSVAWAPSGRSLASAGHDGTVRLWQAETWISQGVLADHRAPVNKVAYSPDGRLIASASMDSTVRIWDLVSGGYVRVLEDFDGWWVNNLSFSPDGRFLATIDQDPTIRVWEIDSPRPVWKRSVPFGNTTVNWSPDGSHLASGGLAREQIWRLSAE